MGALREVVCLIFYKDGKLLLEQRLDKHTANKWTFTGGKVEPEDKAEGLDYKKVASIRESMEETNLIPTECEHLETFEEVSITGETFIFHSMMIVSWRGRLKNMEPFRRRLHWIPMGNVGEYMEGNEVDRRVLEAFLAHQATMR